MSRPTPSISEKTPPEDADAVAEFEVLLAYLGRRRLHRLKRSSLMAAYRCRMQARCERVRRLSGPSRSRSG